MVLEARERGPFLPGGLGTAAGPAPVLYDDRGTVAGRFPAPPRGVILHGSRSGQRWSRETEFEVTRGFARQTELGWHVTVGDDMLAVHLTPEEWGWHARAASSLYLAAEFAQPTVEDPISDAQVRAFCWWLRTQVFPRWPFLREAIARDLTHTLPTHAEVEQWGLTGAKDGKTDVYPYGSPAADALRARIAATLGRALR